MTRAIDSQDRSLQATKQFQKFVFIGNNLTKSSSLLAEQLHLTPNSNFLARMSVGSSLTITQIHTSKDITARLRNLQFEPGKTAQLVSKTRNGSVIIDLNNRLIGVGAEIARRIVVMEDRAK